jgi:hypothetical protein
MRRSALTQIKNCDSGVGDRIGCFESRVASVGAQHRIDTELGAPSRALLRRDALVGSIPCRRDAFQKFERLLNLGGPVAQTPGQRAPRHGRIFLETGCKLRDFALDRHENPK